MPGAAALVAVTLAAGLSEVDAEQYARMIASGSRSEVDQAINKVTYAGAARAMTPRLIATLNTGTDDGRANAAYALGYLGDARAAGPLGHSLADEAVAVRLNAAIACGRLKLRETGRSLVKALDDRASGVRREAARALGLVRYGRAAPALVRLAVDEDLEVRATALFAAGLVGNKEVIPRLRDLEGDASESVRVGATRALAMLGDKKARESIGTMFLDHDPERRRAGVGLLGDVRQDWAASALARTLEDADLSVRLAAARALARQNDDRGIAFLVVAADRAAAEEKFRLEQILEDLRVTPEMRRAALARAARQGKR